jgi:enoyl-CoA hydratase
MSDDALREDRDGVAIVTLNRPDKLNAINKAMQSVIFGAVDDLRERRDLRALLIQARGRFFTAGIDVSETSLTDSGGDDERSASEVRRDYRRGLHIFLDEMEAVEKPIVMAIHAPCLGVGVEMAGAVDFRLAAESARFGLPEIDLGVIAGSGGVSRFTRLCGVGWSKWLNVAGEQIDARTAQMAGFVQAVYPDKDFEREVWAFCQRLVSRPAEVQAVAKLAVELCRDLDRSQGRQVERLVNAPLMMQDNSELVNKAMNRGKSKK